MAVKLNFCNFTALKNSSLKGFRFGYLEMLTTLKVPIYKRFSNGK